MDRKWEIVFSGVGGQGLLLDGTILASAVIEEGNHAVMTATYGTETRGTFTKADLIVSHEEIDFPEALAPDAVIALAQVAYDRYAPRLGEKALLLYDSDQVNPIEANARQLGAPMLAIARAAGNASSLNMAALGFLLGHIPLAKAESVLAVIARQFQGREALISCNERAFAEGLQQAKR